MVRVRKHTRLSRRGAEPLTIHMVRTGRGSTVKERGGATHYSYGEGSLTIHMVRVSLPNSRPRERVFTLTHHMGEGPYFFIGVTHYSYGEGA